jgi:tRNA dimethylallyltransferase
MKRRIIVIAGPTAVGKTEYAIRAAQDFNGEIVSADSMQLYKFMDIGSAKPTADERSAAKHYLVDEIDPREDFSVAEYSKLAKGYIEKIFAEGKLPVISGGTGLYINSLIYDMDFSSVPQDAEERSRLRAVLDENGPEYLHNMLREIDPNAAARIHPNNTKKVIRAIEAAKSGSPIPDFEQSFKKTKDYEYLLIGLNRERQELYERINLRVDMMLEAGLENEIKELMRMGLDSDNISMKGIGYKEMIAAFNGEYGFDEAAELIKRSSRRYAKRQLTWLRRYPDMHWFDLSAGAEGEYERMTALIREFLNEEYYGRKEKS